MKPDVIKRVVQAYGLEPLNIKPVQSGYRNQSYAFNTIKGELNLILYKQEPGILERIRRTNAISNYLANNLPTRQTQSSKIVCLSAGEFKKYGCLYNYLPGETIPWEAYTMERIKNLGGMLGHLHRQLQTFDYQPMVYVADEYLAICKQMDRYFSRSGVNQACSNKLKLNIPSQFNKYEKLIKMSGQIKGQQWLHMDFVRGNILFEGNKVTGVLDFEKTAYGSPYFDLARTLAFLLVDCDKPANKIKKYFIESGYKKRGGQKLIINQKLMDGLVEMFLIYDFYKFLKYSPYEFLEQNHHFRRTRDILLERKVVSLA